MGTLLQDLRYGLRALWNRPGFTITAVLTLALGIGANTVVFSLFNAVLLRPLNFSQPDRLVWIWATRTDRDKAFYSIPNFQDTQEQNQTLQDIAAFTNWGANLTGRAESQRLQGVRVSANAFQLLGTEPLIGRVLTRDDDLAGSGRVVVLSYNLWQQLFAGSSEALGQNMILNGDSYTVVGVLTKDFSIPNAEIDMVTPLKAAIAPRRTERGSNFLRVFGRLKSGITIAQARSDLAAITERLRTQFPKDNAKLTAPNVLLMHDEVVGAHRNGLVLLLAAVFFVLLIACANLANLSLSRSAGREKEIVIRASLGASRGRLLRQLLVESLLLACIGGGLGLLLAVASQGVLPKLLPPDLPRVNATLIDARILLFCFLLSSVSGLLFGLFPAISSTKIDLNETLKEGGRGSSQVSGSSRLRKSLVTIEVALSVSLLIGALLLIKSFTRIQKVDTGFQPNNLTTMRISLPPAQYPHPIDLKTFYQKIASRLRDVPSVADVGAVNALPLSNMNVRTEFTIVGRPPLSATDQPGAQNRWVSPNYFQIMGVNVLEGRGFSENDDENAARVVVIDRALAQHFWPNGAAVGNHLLVDFGNDKPIDCEIIGVVENLKYFALNDPPLDTLYLPFFQVPQNSLLSLTNYLSLVVRDRGNSQNLVTAIRQEMQRIDPLVPVSNARAMNSYLDSSLAARRFSLTLLSVFAAVALLLAAVGIYAVISYSVTQRTREFGVRLALGAQPADVLRMVVRQGMTPAVIGVVLGLVNAWILTKLMTTLLFQVSPTDLFSFVVVSGAVPIIALLASYLPARRAMRVDPIVALRYQ